MQVDAFYIPHSDQLVSIINILPDPHLSIVATRSIKYFDLQLAHSSISCFEKLSAFTPLGLLLLAYQPEFDASIKLLIDKGAKLRAYDLLIIIANANKINPSILEYLFENNTLELNSPLIQNYHIFHFLSLQRFISPILIDFILSKLDPRISYHWQKSGVEFAKEYNHYPLLYYFYKKGYITNPLEAIPTSTQIYQTPHTATTDDFLKAVKSIKHQYNFKSLKKWLANRDTAQIAPNYAIFLANPTIGNFLSRNIVTVTQFKPNYTKQEISFYIGISRLFKIPFRSDGSVLSKAENPLEPGTFPETKIFMHQILKQKMPKKDNFLLIPVRNIIDLSLHLDLLKSLKINNAQYIYVFFLVSKHNHDLFMLSIIDTQKEQILFHITINSWQNFEYINQLSAAINCGKTQDKDHTIPKIFDASLSSQIHEDDIYCTSHTMEIANALYSALYVNHELQQNIEDFAKQENQEQQWEQLKNLLQREIKIRLPMFYDQASNELNLKPRDEVINWHIQNRFSYGSTFINQLRKESEAMIQENQAAIQKIQTQSS